MSMRGWSGSVKQLAVAGALSALMAGCGFQLRGAPPVSSALQPLAVACTSGVPDTLCQAVREQLKLGQVQLTDRENADYILRISDFESDRRASAITAQAAAAEYTLRHAVDLEVVTADGVPLVANTRLNTTESYRYDETNVLAKQREEEALSQQMDDRLAQQIIFRLAPLTSGRIEALRQDYQNSQTSDPTSTDKP
ncbi:MAG: LPS assembly lipoprotein LptE [Pseudomonadota bacterium]|nr:LPS assembly lipoprotein LptE [Pseudomonadota bacterium]